MLFYVNLGVEYEKNKKKIIRISFPVQKLQKFKKNSKFSKIEFLTLDPQKFLKVKKKINKQLLYTMVTKKFESRSLFAVDAP